jgi:PhnB protein
MASTVKPIPEGFHTVTPYLVLHDAAKAIEFYKRAFNATEKMRMDGPHGKVGHAELKIGDSVIMLGDEMQPGASARSPHTLGGTSTGIMLYVKDVDTAFQQAIDAGAKVEQPVQDMFWGDRYGKLLDPFGHSWSLATHKEDVAPAEMEKRMQAFAAKMGEQKTKSAT